MASKRKLATDMYYKLVILNILVSWKVPFKRKCKSQGPFKLILMIEGLCQFGGPNDFYVVYFTFTLQPDLI